MPHSLTSRDFFNWVCMVKGRIRAAALMMDQNTFESSMFVSFELSQNDLSPKLSPLDVDEGLLHTTITRGQLVTQL